MILGKIFFLLVKHCLLRKPDSLAKVQELSRRQNDLADSSFLDPSYSYFSKSEQMKEGRTFFHSCPPRSSGTSTLHTCIPVRTGPRVVAFCCLQFKPQQVSAKAGQEVCGLNSKKKISGRRKHLPRWLRNSYKISQSSYFTPGRGYRNIPALKGSSGQGAR